MKRYECICDGCKEIATLFLIFNDEFKRMNDSWEPHCTSCMIDAMSSKPTMVIDIEAYEYAQRKEVVKSGQAPIARTA